MRFSFFCPLVNADLCPACEFNISEAGLVCKTFLTCTEAFSASELTQKMPKNVKLLAAVSRPEFLPANLGSLIMGFAWATNPSLNLANFAIPAIISFGIITVVSAFGAQLNTMSDYELDSRDSRKQRLVKAMDYLGRNKVKLSIIIEFLLGVILVSFLLFIQWKPILLFLWIGGVFLAYAYSTPPLRLKSRSWLAFCSLLLVLCVLPVLFVYYTFTSELDSLFLLFLTGQALTVYAIIIPTEIRDYFGDKAMKVETLTVRLGLVKASFLGIVLLIAGGLLSGTAFFLKLTFELQTALSIFLFVMAVADYVVLREFKKLYLMSREHSYSKDQNSTEQKIVELAAHNPKWINIVSQAIVFMSIMLLVGKFYF